MRQRRATARRRPTALDQVDSSTRDADKENATGEAPDPESLRAHLLRYQDWLRVRHYAARTIEGRAKCLRLFLDWLEVRSLTLPHEVTRAVFERYQRHLFERRKRNVPDVNYISPSTTITSPQLSLTPPQGVGSWLSLPSSLSGSRW